MNCRLPKKIGIPSGGGTSYPEGAFIPVTKFTAGKSYALVAKIDGVYRYINTTAFNNYTMNATEVSVTPGGGYVTFGSEPALFKAEASGDGFTLGNGSNFLHGTSSGGTALRVGTTSAVWKVDTSETGGFDSGKYLPKEVSSSVWLKNTTGGYDWSIKFESAGSFGYDRAGRDSTYSTGFVSFILYEKYEGSGDSGDTPSGTVTLTVTHDGTASGTIGGTVSVNGTVVEKGTTLEVAVGTVVEVTATGYNASSSYITLNGVEVARGSAAQPYKYTIQENTTISYAYENSAGVVTITTGGSSGGGTTPSEYAVTFSGGNSNYWIIANGTKYTSDTTLSLAVGSTITLAVNVSVTGSAKVQINGTQVHTFSSSASTYELTITANTTIRRMASYNGFTITTE